jgi:class 3 adenylate cyclase
VRGLPQPVVEYLCAVATADAAPAYLRVDPGGTVVGAGGRLEGFGLDAGVVGRAAESRLDALVGLLPAPQGPLCLPTVEVAPGVHADVHVVGDGEGAWVVLVDRTAWAAERRVAQQLSNDMSLLRAELGRRGGGTGPLDWERRYTFREAGARRFASVLTAVIGGLARLGDDEPPAEAVGAAGLYVRAIGLAVADEAGVLQSVCGERVTAVFGLLPTTANPAALAAAAAVRAVAAVDELNAARAREGTATFPVSIGVASGVAAFGALGGHANRMLGALGGCVERSPRVAAIAGPGGIAVDGRTYDELDEERPRFRRGPDDPEGPTPTYYLVTR